MAVNYAWTWADVQKSDRDVPHNWKSLHYGSKRRQSAGAMARFIGGGAHFATERSASLREDHPALASANTMFPKSVRDAGSHGPVLKSGLHNAKTGAFITKGPWRGARIFTLTLEERATCPRTCELWRSCYGNAMPFAARHRHGPELEAAVAREVEALLVLHDRIAVRLHVLGDFYSESYAQFWQRLIVRHPRLHVWGYTHHKPNSLIGRRLQWLNTFHPDRCAIRFSVPPTAAPRRMQATTIWRAPEASVVPEGQVCPASVEATAACGTCGLCWERDMRDKRIVFPGHGMGPRGVKGQGRLL